MWAAMVLFPRVALSLIKRDLFFLVTWDQFTFSACVMCVEEERVLHSMLCRRRRLELHDTCVEEAGLHYHVTCVQVTCAEEEGLNYK